MKTAGICIELIVRGIVAVALVIGTLGLAIFFFDFDDFMEVRR